MSVYRLAVQGTLHYELLQYISMRFASTLVVLSNLIVRCSKTRLFMMAACIMLALLGCQNVNSRKVPLESRLYKMLLDGYWHDGHAIAAMGMALKGTAS